MLIVGLLSRLADVLRLFFWIWSKLACIRSLIFGIRILRRFIFQLVRVDWGRVEMVVVLRLEVKREL